MKKKGDSPLFLVVAAVLCTHCGGTVPPSTAPWAVDHVRIAESITSTTVPYSVGIGPIEGR